MFDQVPAGAGKTNQLDQARFVSLNQVKQLNLEGADIKEVLGVLNTIGNILVEKRIFYADQRVSFRTREGAKTFVTVDTQNLNRLVLTGDGRGNSLFASDLVRFLCQLAHWTYKETQNSTLVGFESDQADNFWLNRWGGLENQAGDQPRDEIVSFDEAAFLKHYPEILNLFHNIVTALTEMGDDVKELATKAESAADKVGQKEVSTAKVASGIGVSEVGDGGGGEAAATEQAVQDELPTVFPAHRTRAQTIRYESAWLYNRVLFDLFAVEGNFDFNSINFVLKNELFQAVNQKLWTLSAAQLNDLFASPSGRVGFLRDFYLELLSNPQLASLQTNIAKLKDRVAEPAQEAAQAIVDQFKNISGFDPNANSQDPLVVNAFKRVDEMLYAYGASLEELETNSAENYQKALKIINSARPELLMMIFFPDLADSITANQINAIVPLIREILLAYAKVRASEIILKVQSGLALSGIEGKAGIEQALENNQESIAAHLHFANSQLSPRNLEEQGKFETQRSSKLDKRREDIAQLYTQFERYFNFLPVEVQTQIYLAAGIGGLIPAESIASGDKLEFKAAIFTNLSLEDLVKLGRDGVKQLQFNEAEQLLLEKLLESQESEARQFQLLTEEAELRRLAAVEEYLARLNKREQVELQSIARAKLTEEFEIKMRALSDEAAAGITIDRRLAEITKVQALLNDPDYNPLPDASLADLREWSLSAGSASAPSATQSHLRAQAVQRTKQAIAKKQQALAKGILSKLPALAKFAGPIGIAASIISFLAKNKELSAILAGTAIYLIAKLLHAFSTIGGAILGTIGMVIGGPILAVPMALLGAQLVPAQWTGLFGLNVRTPPFPLGDLGESSVHGFSPRGDFESGAAGKPSAGLTSPAETAPQNLGAEIVPSPAAAPLAPAEFYTQSVSNPATPAVFKTQAFAWASGMSIGAVISVMSVFAMMFLSIYTIYTIFAAFLVPIPTADLTKRNQAESKYMILSKIPNPKQLPNSAINNVTYSVSIKPKPGYAFKLISPIEDNFSAIGDQPPSPIPSSPLGLDDFSDEPSSSPQFANYSVEISGGSDVLLKNTLKITYDVYTAGEESGSPLKTNQELEVSATVRIGDPDVYCWPTTGEVTQLPGGSFSHSRSDSYDISAPIGTTVYAPFDGMLRAARFVDLVVYGSYAVALDFQEAGKSHILIFGHMHRLINFSMSDPPKNVSAGDPIGEVGNLGFSTGPHLHYELLSASLKIEDLIPEEDIPVHEGATVYTCY